MAQAAPSTSESLISLEHVRSPGEPEGKRNKLRRELFVWQGFNRSLIIYANNRLASIGEVAKVLGADITALRRWERAGKITTGRTLHCHPPPGSPAATRKTKNGRNEKPFVARQCAASVGECQNRDVNAAINLENYAVSSTVTACGEEGSGSGRKTRVKPASMKQETNSKPVTGQICPDSDRFA
jgi:hypothetical protein